jgi:hypothetical protein
MFMLIQHQQNPSNESQYENTKIYLLKRNERYTGSTTEISLGLMKLARKIRNRLSKDHVFQEQL